MAATDVVTSDRSASSWARRSGPGRASAYHWATAQSTHPLPSSCGPRSSGTAPVPSGVYRASKTPPGERGGNEGCVPRPDVPPPIGGAGDRDPTGENQRVEVAQRMLGEVGVPGRAGDGPASQPGVLLHPAVWVVGGSGAHRHRLRQPGAVDGRLSLIHIS